jgi:hypothetical protein
MEAWLLAGPIGVVLLSVASGGLLGWAERLFLGRDLTLSAGRVLMYAFLATSAFSYFKDGDLLTTSVGTIRSAVYLGIIILATGVWRASHARGETGGAGPAMAARG